MYRDNFTLYRTTLALNPDCWMAHNNLGQLLAAQPGRGPEARAEYEEALRLKPDYADAHNNLGLELSDGTRPEAPTRWPSFNEALRLKPDYPGTPTTTWPTSWPRIQAAPARGDLTHYERGASGSKPDGNVE